MIFKIIKKFNQFSELKKPKLDLKQIRKIISERGFVLKKKGTFLTLMN